MAQLTSKQAVPKGRFRVRADGMPSISFKMAEGLKIALEISKYKDGTDQLATLKIGKSELDNLVLTAGESIESLQPWWDWLQACRNASANGGLIGEDLMKTIDVIPENDDGSSVFTVRNTKCLPVSIELDARDGDSADTALDKFEVAVTDRNLVWGAASG